MRTSFLSRTRKWIGASALAILVGIGGGSAFLAASSPSALAQIQPAAQITLPKEVTPTSFADLVEAVKPAVVSIVVEGDEAVATCSAAVVNSTSSSPICRWRPARFPRAVRPAVRSGSGWSGR